MPIMLCAKCRKPVADSFHDFTEVCECISISEQKRRAKLKGWNIKFPKEANMDEAEIERIMQEVNEWSIEDLRELADRCNSLADALEQDSTRNIEGN